MAAVVVVAAAENGVGEGGMEEGLVPDIAAVKDGGGVGAALRCPAINNCCCWWWLSMLDEGGVTASPPPPPLPTVRPSKSVSARPNVGFV